MASAGTLDEPELLLLPEDLLNNIGSWLDDKELCRMELASKELHLILSNPSRPGSCERRLDLGALFNTNHPPSPQACRLPPISAAL